MWHTYISAATTDEAIQALAEHGAQARLVAGATDLMLELERGVRKGVTVLIDITRIPGLNQITRAEDGTLHLGPLVTHNDCAANKLIRDRAYPLARACWEVGAPQIRNRGTVAGNLITASPANDTITPLMGLDATVTLQSVRGTRQIKLQDFYTGVRKTVLQPDEMLVDISFMEMSNIQRGTFVKLALRRAQAISVINVAIILSLDSDTVAKAAITLGAVAPTIIHAPEAELYLADKSLSDEVIAEAARLTMAAAKPIDDIRASAAYRREMVRVVTARGLRSLRESSEQNGMPSDPITLGGGSRHKLPSDPVTLGSATPRETLNPFAGATHVEGDDIHTIINGKEMTLRGGNHKSLLRLLRENALLTGTKEGCAEGECGACTVFLDGKAVMACMVPAPRAQGAEIVTVEGLAALESGGLPLEEQEQAPELQKLHPVQQAFIEDGAVQCGYCTPGFIMAAAKLLEERPKPTRNEIEQALTGNLCRCTGYYKIVKAIERASRLATGELHG
jgi:carbon-monoxide dehydrogenase medium subunit